MSVHGYTQGYFMEAFRCFITFLSSSFLSLENISCFLKPYYDEEDFSSVFSAKKCLQISNSFKMWLLTVFSPTQSARTYNQRDADAEWRPWEESVKITRFWEKSVFVPSGSIQRSYRKESAVWINVFQLVHDRKNPFTWVSFFRGFLFRFTIKDFMMRFKELEQKEFSYLNTAVIIVMSFKWNPEKIVCKIRFFS